MCFKDTLAIRERRNIDSRKNNRKILKKAGLVRKYRIKKIKYKYIRALRQPGELIEIDVKYVPGTIAGKRYYQYTAIDTASRWRYLAVYDEQTNFHSVPFLKAVIKTFEYKIQAVKTDNGSDIYKLLPRHKQEVGCECLRTLHGLDMFCKEKNIVHYLIDPGKPGPKWHSGKKPSGRSRKVLRTKQIQKL